LIRTSFSFVTLLCTALLLLSLQSTGHASGLTASALSGPNGKINLYTVGSGATTSTGTKGSIYFQTADGAWFNGNFSKIQVTSSSDGSTQANAVALGYLYDAYPSIATIVCKRNSDGSTTVSVTIVNYWTGALYESTGEGKVMQGAVTLTL